MSFADAGEMAVVIGMVVIMFVVVGVSGRFGEKESRAGEDEYDANDEVGSGFDCRPQGQSDGDDHAAEDDADGDVRGAGEQREPCHARQGVAAGAGSDRQG